MGSLAGAEQTAARRVGVDVETWRARRAAGEKWYTGCKDWHSISTFGIDRSRHDGRKASCDAACLARARAARPPALGLPPGPPPEPPRDGDARQARGRVNVHVRTGRWPIPNELSCVDCGHVWSAGERRHEYDHHLGYGSDHHEDVEACTLCHHARERAPHGHTREGGGVSVVYVLAALATLCVLRTLAPAGPTPAIDLERMGAAAVAAVAVGMIVRLAA